MTSNWTTITATILSVILSALITTTSSNVAQAAQAGSNAPAGFRRTTISGASDHGCERQFESNSAYADYCVSSNGHALVTVTWLQDENESPTVIKALFAPKANKLWQRIWVAEGNPVIDADAQLELRRAVFESAPRSLNPRVHAVFDFITNFVPADTSVQVFDRKFSDQLLAEQSIHPFFELICESIGKARDAIVSVNEDDEHINVTVGDPKSSCLGRCGIGCYQPFQWRGQQYTQECLNHDACTAKTGEVLGQCQWHFFMAALGYLLAPDCD